MKNKISLKFSFRKRMINIFDLFVAKQTSFISQVVSYHVCFAGPLHPATLWYFSVLPATMYLMSLPSENYISFSFHIEWDMIVVTVLLLILNQMEFHLVQNRKGNCHHDHISFNMKGNGNLVFSVYGLTGTLPHP